MLLWTSIGAFAFFSTPVVRARVVNHLSFFAAADPLALSTQTIDLPIDHFNGTSGTFKNRYWVNDTYYQPGGPVVVWDSGEADAHPDVTLLAEADGTQSAVMQVAAKYHGIGVVWEHRYYGQSLPYLTIPLSPSYVGNYTADQWKFLTVDQALEDVVVFASNFTLPADSPAARRLLSKDALQASKTPWIFIGGSYPGMRAALLRVRNPETIFASWASSAPVQAQVDMTSYSRAVQRGLPKNCSADYAVAVKYADDALNSGNATLASEVKLVLAQAEGLSPGSEPVTQATADNYTAIDVVRVLKSPFNPSFQYYGPAGMQIPCDTLETLNGTVSPSDAGLASTLGPEGTFHAVVNMMVAPSELYSPNTTDQSQSDQMSWDYQSCSQLGFFQVADRNDSASIVSQGDTLAAEQAWCNTEFPGMLPSSPRVGDILKYGGWKMNPTRTFFSNGELDPWRTLSVGSVESNAPFRNASTTVPGFDAAPADGTYYGAIYAGQVHCSDLSGGPTNTDGSNAAFQKGLTMFTKALDTWLPQFKASNGTTSSTSTKSSLSPSATTEKAPNGVSAPSVHRFTRFYTLGISALFAMLI